MAGIYLDNISTGIERTLANPPGDSRVSRRRLIILFQPQPYFIVRIKSCNFGATQTRGCRPRLVLDAPSALDGLDSEITAAPD
jgi:hypothetical protein